MISNPLVLLIIWPAGRIVLDPLAEFWFNLLPEFMFSIDSFLAANECLLTAFTGF